MAAKSEEREIPGPDRDMSAKENLDRELSRLLEELSGLLKRPSPLAGLSREELIKANAEFQALKVSELPSREVRCTRCQEMISGTRAGKLEGFWEAKEE